MKVDLFFPPMFKASEPYIALPILTGFLQDNGVQDVQAHDLNLDYVHHLFADTTLADVERTLEARRAAGVWLDDAERALTEAASEHVVVVRRWLPDTLELFRRHRAPSYVNSIPREVAEREASQIELMLEMAFEVYSARYYPWRFENPITRREAVLSNERWSVEASNNVAWRECLTSHAHPRDPFRDFFEATVGPRLDARRPDVVGISLMFRQQLVAAFTLAAVVRNHLPHVHICLGGALFSDLEHYLFTAPSVRDAVFRDVDSVVIGPGEVPLLTLVRTLEARRSVDTIANVLTRANVSSKPTAGFDGHGAAGLRVVNGDPIDNKAHDDVQGRLTSSFVAAGRDAPEIRQFPTPVFFDGDLERYFYRTPELTIPYLTSYGCYWNKCSFCKYRDQVHRYSPKPVERVAEDLRLLSERHGSRRFHFSDETLSPSYCRRFSAHLDSLSSEPGYRWSGNARFDPGFDEDLVAAMKRSGCEYISFGLESGSQRIIERMGKGTRVEVVERTMQAFRTVGLAVNLYLFVGFPGETEDDLEATSAFLLRHRDIIVDLSVGPFTLYKGTAVFRDPARYGICNVELGDQVDPEILKWTYEYDLAPGVTGLKPEQAMKHHLVSHREIFGAMGEGLSPDGLF